MNYQADLEIKDEEVLIESARREPEAFALLYRRYLTPVYRYLLSRLNNIHDAEDITAQVFSETLEGLANFHYRKDGCFAAWLFTIARRRLIDFYRHHPVEQLDDPPSLEPELLSVIEKSENLRHLDQLIGNLNGDQRELLRLRFSADLSFAEIALLEGRSEAAVKMALYRLLDILKSKWEVENERD